MRNTIKSVLPPLISLVIVMLGNGFFNTFSSLRIAIEGYDSLVIGAINSAYYLGMMVGCLYIETLISRIGHIRSFAMFASINSLVFLFQGFYINPISWSFFRLLTGLCSSGFFIVIESWLLLSTGVKHRGKLLSLYMLTLYMAQGFGQFLLNVIPIKSLFPYVISVGLSSLSVLPVSMMKSSGPLGVDHSSLNLWQIIKRAPLGPIGCFLAGMVMSSFYGLAPIFGKEINLNLLQISQIMGGTILGGLLLQWPAGHLSDIFSRKHVLIVSVMSLLAVTLILFFFYGISYWFLLAFMIIFGSISFTFYPLSISYTCDYFSPSKVIGITSSCLIIYGIGCVVGPLVSSSAMQFLGPAYLMLSLAILAGIFLLFAFVLVQKHKPFSDDESHDYLPTPHATTLGYYLDPKMDMEEKEEYDEEQEETGSLYEEYEDDEDDE